MAQVYILSGKIASGKTTYAKQLCEQETAIILSVDDVMLKLFDGCLSDRHNDMAKRILQYFYTLVPYLIANHTSVIFDYGFWSEQERIQIEEHFQTAKIAYQGVYIVCDDKVRKQRLKVRNEAMKTKANRQYIIGEEMLERFDQWFEEPNETYRVVNM